MPDLTGTTLGKYRLLERLGRGGMAEVYRAFQPSLEREVAVKVMYGYLAEDADFVGRFKREAKAVATLRHPHIVQVYDFDVEGEVYYMVMEYIAGETLKARLERLNAAGQRMALSEVCEVLRPLCSALDYAHAQGRIHRDIKPANIMFDGRRLVLTDFGIATIVGGTCFTAPGTMIGTPAYMSPEQCRGEPGDVRSDIYSLGIVLYEMITGNVPYDADTPLAVVLKHLNDPLPLPARVVPDLPAAVQQVVLKALAKAPEDRYESAAALYEAFAAAVGEREELEKPGGTVPAASAPARSAGPAVVAGVPLTMSPEEPPPAPGLPPSAVGRPATTGRWPIWAWGSVLALLLVVIPIFVLLGIPRLRGAAPAGVAIHTPPPGALPTETLRRPTAAAEPTVDRSQAQEYYDLGVTALTEAGNPAQAIANFTAAIAADPSWGEAYFWRGIAYREDGQPSASIADLTQAIALAPDWAEAYYERGRTYLSMDPAQATESLADFTRAIELDPEYAAAYLRRAQATYWFLDDAGGALADLDQALALDPGLTEARWMRGEIYLYQEEFALAQADLEQVVAVAPDDVHSQQLLALAYYWEGEYGLALERCDEALGYAPDDPTTYYVRAFAAAAMGDKESALADLERVLELEPGYSGAYYLRGRLYAEAGRYEEAITDFTATLQDEGEGYAWPFFPHDSPYIDRALAYEALGRNEEALADLSAAVERWPEWHLPYFHRGLVYKALGETQLAVADLEKAYELAPDDDWRARVEQELSQLAP